MKQQVSNPGVIYSITAPDGKQYIGSAANFRARKRVHLCLLRRGTHHSRYLQRAWRKHGENSFRFSVLLICRRDDLYFYEQRALDMLKPAFNISPVVSGTRGLRWTEEQKQKQRGPRPPEFGRAVSAGMLRNTTHEQRSEQSRKARACWTEDSNRNREAKLRGKKHPIETVEKRRASMIGHPVSQETREKLAMQRGWKHSEAAKEKMRRAKRLRREARQTKD